MRSTRLLKILRIHERWRAIRFYVINLYHRVGEHHALLLSGGLAYSLFVCAIPLALVVIFVLGKFFARPAVEEKIFQVIDALIPYATYARDVKEFIGERLDQLAGVSEVVGVVGLVGLFFAATGLFSSLRTILNSVFEQKDEESILIGKLWDFALILGILLLVVILMITLPALEALLELASELHWLDSLRVTSVETILLWVLSLSVLMIVFTAVYWFVPVHKPRGRAVIVGAAWASILWLLAKELFGVYINQTATLRIVYGAYSFAVVAAFWIYYSALVLIAGAEIGQLYTERHRQLRPGSKQDAAGSEDACLNG